MRRVLVPALAAALMGSGTASAQGPLQSSEPTPFFRITPVFGQATQFERNERWIVSDGTLDGTFAIKTRFAAGPVVGGVAELRLISRLSLIGSGLYVARKSTIDFETSQVAPGSNFLLAKAGLALRLVEPLREMQVPRITASIFVAPALVREMPKADPEVDPSLSASLDHIGVNAGIEAEIPISGNLIALQLGAEDFIVWWNDAELAARFDRATAASGFTTLSTVDTDPSHMWVFRVGLTLRIHL